MEKIKQIEKIIKYNGMHRHTGSVIVDNVCKEIAALYEGWVPPEFVEWKDWQTNLKNIRHYFKRNEYRFEGKDITLPELFQYWENNIKEL